MTKGGETAAAGARFRPQPARLMAAVAAALAVALVASLMPVAKASAYYTLGTVSVYTGASYLTVQAGSSTSTSVTVDPASDSQTLGCGMAKCPQVCMTDDAIEAGYSCFDANGQCTCSGHGYSTYYSEVSASSSNSGVATAYISGGTLVVTGHAPGTATIAVNASLRQWASGGTSIQVQVTEPAAGSGSGSSSPGGPASSSSSATGASSAAALPEAAQATDSRDDALNETVTETVAGKVYSVENNGFLNTREELEKVVGTTDQMVFWSGPSSSSPDYSWTFVGDEVDAASAFLEFDPTITISKLGTGDVSNVMKQAKDGLVLEFAHEGELPGTATVYVKVDDVFADGQVVNLFSFDASEKRFKAMSEVAVRVEGGYASFKTDRCSTWALSSDDLASYQVEETNTPRAIAADEPIAVDSGANPAVVAAVVVALAVLAAGCTVVLRRRKRAAGAVGTASAAGADASEGAAGETDLATDGASAGAASVDDAGVREEDAS